MSGMDLVDFTRKWLQNIPESHQHRIKTCFGKGMGNAFYVQLDPPRSTPTLSKIEADLFQNPSQNGQKSELGGGLGAHCGQSRLPNLRNSWAVLGTSWGRLWGVLEHLKTETGGLEALWVVLWASLGHREGTHRKMWNLMPFERCTINRTQKRGKPKIISKSLKRINRESIKNQSQIEQKSIKNGP